MSDYNSYDSITEELDNGAPLPDHPATTTSRKIIAYGSVHDADDGTELTAGLHRSTVSALINNQHALGHLYRYAIFTHDGKKRIFHTRPRVTIRVKTELTDGAI
jgi:hypothetical protein